jgi:CrcB protein
MVDPRAIAAVAAGAALGGVLRLLITQFVLSRYGLGTGHYATLFINVSGSFLIGVVIEVLHSRAGADPLWRLFLATGILGGYTTFSTFSLEVLTLWTAGFALQSALYLIGSVVLGVAGAIAGMAAARTLAPP